MRWIWTLILAATLISAGYAEESVEFPFNRTTRVTFIRLGNMKADAGQQFVLQFEGGTWTIERRISRTQETVEEISAERANEILVAFAGLYSHWQERPYFDREKGGYSMFISIDDNWCMALSVKDRGSPALSTLLDVIDYPDGISLEGASADKAPGVIRASSANAQESPEATGEKP